MNFFAPPSYNILTIFEQVVPLTIESSINIIDLFFIDDLFELSFNFTPKLLIFCFGSIKVFQRNDFLLIQVQIAFFYAGYIQ